VVKINLFAVDSKIGEIARVKTGGTPSRKKPKYFSGNIPWVKTAEAL
jgi:type I restriction enzyme S subunit